MSEDLLQKTKDEYAIEIAIGYIVYSDFFTKNVYPSFNPVIVEAFNIATAERYTATLTKELQSENNKMKDDIQKLRKAMQDTVEKIKAVDGLGLFDRGNLPNLLNLALDQTKEYAPIT